MECTFTNCLFNFKLAFIFPFRRPFSKHIQIFFIILVEVGIYYNQTTCSLKSYNTFRELCSIYSCINLVLVFYHVGHSLENLETIRNATKGVIIRRSQDRKRLKVSFMVMFALINVGHLCFAVVKYS